ncbi:hypothetical protein FW778_11125 [Ginsengibacter hankyongi]|uniref:Uncharacterized protein n=1 Tax=Ginsengibacter hankyongi TaxID=2607284 RepID=A0A5J5II60_9BACT|nr:hypothetical protein [Ginsengibacter hankyongi]KAA9039373.1 hypothetical protein FW778_11125 [Ginsengibacter hankyongi]
MTKFTPEDLVQYLYNETSVQKTAAIKAALNTDWNLKESFEQLVEAQKNLEKIKLSPRDEAVNKILQHTSKKVGQLHSH